MRNELVLIYQDTELSLFYLNQQKLCNQYWPSVVNETETYGKIEVKFVSTKQETDYTVRNFQLTLDNSYVNVGGRMSMSVSLTAWARKRAFYHPLHLCIG